MNRASTRTLLDVESFLLDEGFAVGDLSGSRTTSDVPGSRRRAAVLLGAAVGARAMGLGAGPPSPVPGVPDACVIVYQAGEPAAQRPRATLGTFVPCWSDAEHADAVRVVQGLIARGEVYQVNVVNSWTAEVQRPGRLDLSALGGAYAGFMHGDGWQVACASPELLGRVAGGRVVTEPVKGTVHVKHDLDGSGLRASLKDRAEHVMIVDLERNDLGRVAVTGGVTVDELYRLQRWNDLWHAHSRVSAELQPGTSLAQVLTALLPGGSVTGAPKHAAVQSLQGLERVGRGPSMGALGWISQDGTVDLGLTIRTAALDESTSRCVVWAGGGVTWSSDPDAEVAEARAKARPVLDALR